MKIPNNKAPNPSSGWTKLLLEFQNALAWVISIEVRIDNRNRFKNYEKTIFELACFYDVNELLAFENNNKKTIINAVYETTLLVFIWKVFHKSNIKNLSDLFALSINGPTTHSIESAKSNKERNYFFELLVAADFYGSGFPIEIGLNKSDADIWVITPRFKLAIECKRPQSARGFLNSIKDGVLQINRRVQTQPSSKGILFISFDKLMNPDLTLSNYHNKLQIYDSLHSKSNALISPTLKRLKRSLGDSVLAFVTDLRIPVNLIPRSSRFSIARFSLFNTVGAVSPQNREYLDSIFSRFSTPWNKLMMTV